MSLANAFYALEELAEGRIPDEGHVLRGLSALDPFLLQSGHDREFDDAAELLELLLATGTASVLTEARARAAAMAAAVRRLMVDG